MYKLKWTNRCCGCAEEIKPLEKTYIMSDMASGGCIHFCEKCANKIKEVSTR